ncbi:hypothetical protein [Opitutus terrae]|uniref:Conserved hypothetical secreted protein n=1 Tax=Opitutus terrae (strain DSM 11246 / JCM 15787 / PB90-1) TaxID=452637 RepID=B1ZTF8_OPITP|nr:hypothetical protein [Opitutus terrae]ACB73903.1 conserved hypothetical secreted protein [Opitutus terrae PB90-1]
MKSFLLRILPVAIAVALGSALHGAPVLAGHSGLNGQSLDAEGAKSVLLGKRVTIGDARVVIVIAKASAAQDAFLQSHVGMNTSQFQNHWRRLFMTGGGSAPKIVETEADACKAAAETPGAVVVADAAAATGLAVLAN